MRIKSITESVSILGMDSSAQSFMRSHVVTSSAVQNAQSNYKSLDSHKCHDGA